MIRLQVPFLNEFRTQTPVVGSNARSASSPESDLLHPTAADGYTASNSSAVTLQVSGHSPVSAGSIIQQTRSFIETNVLTGAGTALNVAHGLLGRFFPPDKVADLLIQKLPLQPVTDESKATLPEYQSHIQNATPDQVYKEFVDHTREAFAAGGSNLLLSDGGIKDQGRYMVEANSKGPAPTAWLPVEVHLDPEKKEVDLQCLQGHVFRGHNEFMFKSDGHGGTLIDQKSDFQLSSLPMSVVKGPMKIVDKQHAMWESVHGFLANHFAEPNGASVTSTP